MNKVTALVISIIAFVGIACSAVGTLTPEPTETLITNTPKATLTSTVTLTPTQEATEIATAGTVEVTNTFTPDFNATPTPIVAPEATATYFITTYTPEETTAGDEFIEVMAPVVNVRAGASTFADVVEQLPKMTIRKVYLIYENVSTGEVWAQINPLTEDVPKWISVAPALCRDENLVRINCTEFRP